MSVWVHQTCPRFFFFKPDLYRDQPCCLSDTCPLALWQHPHVLHIFLASHGGWSPRWFIGRPGSDQFPWQAAAAQRHPWPQRLAAAAADPAEAVAPGAPAAAAAWRCAVEVAGDFGTARYHRTEIEQKPVILYICSVTSYLLLSLLISLLYCRASHTGDTDTIRVMYSIVV